MKRLPLAIQNAMTDEEYEAYWSARLNEAWHHYEETGISYTLEEVDAHAERIAEEYKRRREALVCGGAI